MTIALPEQNIELPAGVSPGLDALRDMSRQSQLNFAALAQLFPLGAEHLKDNAIQNRHLGDGIVGSAELADGAASARKVTLDVPFMNSVNANGVSITPASSGWGALWASPNYTTPPVAMQGFILWAARIDQGGGTNWGYCRTRCTASTGTPVAATDNLTLENTFPNPSSPRYSHHFCLNYFALPASTTFAFTVWAHAEAAATHSWVGNVQENWITGLFWKHP